MKQQKDFYNLMNPYIGHDLILSCFHSNSPKSTHTHTLAYTHTHMQMCTHKHTHVHAHTLSSLRNDKVGVLMRHGMDLVHVFTFVSLRVDEN